MGKERTRTAGGQLAHWYLERDRSGVLHAHEKRVGEPAAVTAVLHHSSLGRTKQHRQRGDSRKAGWHPGGG